MTLLFGPRLHLDWQYGGGGGQIVWNYKECFIFYADVHGGWKITPFEAIKVLLGGGAAFNNTRARVTVFHLHSGSVDPYVIEDFNLESSVIPYMDQLYLFNCVGCSAARNWSQRLSYRWNGSTFVQLDERVTKTTLAELPDISDPIRALKFIREEGWHNERFAFNGRFQRTEVSLGNSKYSVEVRPSSDKRGRLILTGPGPERELVTYNASLRLLSAAKYRSIFSR